MMLIACSIQKSDKIVSYEVFNAGEDAIFPVTSTLFFSQNEVMLVDAQFTKSNAKEIVNKIKASGKPLTLIYISHSDPDFYFGLETILKAYPEARVIATKETVNTIEKTSTHKLRYWRNQLGKEAPTKLIIPVAMTDNNFTFANETFYVKGYADRSYLWLPSKKLILGGSLLSYDMFVWTADAITPTQRLAWDNVIIEMLDLQPTLAIPGHYLGELPQGIEAIEFTHQYLKTFDYILLSRETKSEVESSMLKLYPDLKGKSNLDMSLDAITGEAKF